jgi:hypothetical protein
MVGRGALPFRGEAGVLLKAQQVVLLAKSRLTLVNAPLIAVGMLIAVAVGTFRLRNNP